jgi:hypothetical protein
VRPPVLLMGGPHQGKYLMPDLQGIEPSELAGYWRVSETEMIYQVEASQDESPFRDR